MLRQGERTTECVGKNAAELGIVRQSWCHGTTEGLLLRRVKVDCVEVIVKRVYM